MGQPQMNVHELRDAAKAPAGGDKGPQLTKPAA
jgi:hypothetical protein